MFRTLLLLVATGSVVAVCGQGVGLNNPLPHASALLDLTSTDRGLLIPRMTTTERDAIAAPATSLVIFNTTTARFEYFSGSAWTPLAATGTLDQAYDQGGPGAGRTITADAGAVTIAGTDGLVSSGTFNTGALAPSGSGVRMVWNPRRAAFRAGEGLNTDWDDANIGNYSVAFGRARASGQGAMAWGDYNGNVASGNNSTAFGFGSTASGQYATAWGYYGFATGPNATAWGGFLATAAGSNANAIGAGSQAPSFSETVFGQYNTTYTPISATAWNPFDRLFTIGNGSSGIARSDAFVVLKSGSIGVGTATPGAQLHVRFTPPTSNINPTLRLDVAQATSSTNITFQNSSNANLISMGMAGNGDFGLVHAANFSSTVGDVLRIKPNGNVGLGTLNAQERLHVVGKVRIQDGDQAAGRVLVSDANGTATWTDASATASGTLDQAYDFGGAGAGRTITANAGAVVIAGTDGLVSTGTVGTGSTAPLGAGTRLVWSPFRSAFRAGTVTGAQWNDASIGTHSFATGTNTTASGVASTAIGNLTTASGQSSFASGQITTASGAMASAMGFLTTASGDRASAWGAENVALSYAETVLGIGATLYTPSVNGATQWRSSNASDRLLVVGNSIDANNNNVVDAVERSDALVILKNGNVGIGISAPAETFQVSGRSLFQDGFSANNAALLYRDNTDYMFIGPRSGSSANGGAIALYGSTNAVGGNANGMDVNVPGGRVRFNQTNAQFEFRSTSTSGYTAAMELTDIGLQVGHNSASRAIQFMNAGGERMRIAANGNVGIAMPAPMTALHVVGGITAASTFVSVTSNAFNYSPGNQTYVQMQSNGAAGVRQVILGNGLAPGQLLIIQCTSLASNGISFLDGGNMAVGGGLSRSLDTDDTITFIWSGTKWVEIAFSSN